MGMGHTPAKSNTSILTTKVQRSGLRQMNEVNQELWLKQLEFVQAIITRLTGYNASLKNYCITLVTALCGVAIVNHQPVIGLVSVLPIVIFAILDAQYLRLERRYRALFDLLRSEDPSIRPSFDLSLRRVQAEKFWPAITSWSIVAFYGPLVAGVGLLLIFARKLQ